MRYFWSVLAVVGAYAPASSESVSVKENEGSAAAEPASQQRSGDTAAAAHGRRTLSTAFVRVGPDNLLTVGLRDGSERTLQNVAMRAGDYCGTQLSGGTQRKFCGSYADVVTARPGGTAPAIQPDLAAPNPLQSSR